MSKMILTTLLNAPSNTWRYPQGRAYGDMDIDYLVDCVKIAEEGKLHAAFLADLSAIKDDKIGLVGARKSGSATGFEPTTLLSALAMVTQRIGLITTASTTYTPPYTLARMIASLDHISKGRAGWNLVTSGTDAEAANYGLDQQISSAERYRRASEHVAVVKKLWDSWDDNAFPRDRESGLYFDPSRGRHLHHQGDYFKVRGPLNMPRPPQGHPIISQAGTSEAGYEMAARWGDVIYAKSPTLELGQAFYANLKGRLAKYGRDPSQLAILPGLTVVTGRSVDHARMRFQEVTASLEAEEGAAYLAQWLGGYDLRGLALDEVIPDIPEINIPAEKSRIFLNRGDYRLTLREAMQTVATSLGHLTLLGTPTEVAQQMAQWVREKGADGFSLMPYFLPGGLKEFVAEVVPVLQEMGVFHADYRGKTLRENLGFDRPENLYRADSA